MQSSPSKPILIAIDENNTMENNKSELLYLIAKLLGSLGSDFKHTTDSLREDLDKNRTLGDIVGWDGKVRTSTVSDIDRLHQNIPSNQLHLLTNKSINGNKNVTSIENFNSNSLLRSLIGLYNYRDERCRESYTTLSKQVVDILSDLGACNKKMTDLTDKKKYLENKLNLLQQQEKRCYSKTAMDSLLTLHEKHDEIDNCDDNDIDDDQSVQIISKSNYFNAQKEVPAVLSEIGIQKELVQISADKETTNNSYQQLSGSLQLLLSKLAEIGCLSDGLNRGNIDCGFDFLNARSLGLIRKNNNFASSIGRALIPSAAATAKKLTTRFKKLWTISGHLGNPVYCCVFDRKGQFILSGADDYLIKIWDIYNGQLVRTCRGHIAYITYIAVSPDNSMFASSCTRGSIRVWRLTDGKCLQVLRHEAPVNWMKFDDYTSSLASASDDGICMVWDISKLVAEEDVFVPVFDILYNEKNNKKEMVREISNHNSSSSSVPILNSNNNNDSVIVTIEIADSNTERNDPGDTTSNGRVGLFEWSKIKKIDRNLRNQELLNSYLLPLHHIQDNSLLSTSTSLYQKVRCLDISPVTGIVVTGCEDGIARIWRFNDDIDPVFANKMMKTLTTIDTMKKEINHENLKIMRTMAKHLLLRLEGHVSPITDIHVNKNGDRILTASSDDGNVRIWSFSRSYLKSTHIVLRLYEEEEESAQPLQNQTRGRSGYTSKARAKLQVHNVCWSSDNTKVITIQSVPTQTKIMKLGKAVDAPHASRLKVWDSMNGDLLRVVWNVSDGPCTGLVPHPLDSTIVITSGEDGLVNIWDIDQESNLSSIKLTNDDGTPSLIGDTSISQDGTFIAVTDGVGRVTLIGLDDPERYRDVFTEQYFSSDYAAVMIDDRGFAIDVGTQLPVHESPPGTLCRLDHTPYFTQRIVRVLPTILTTLEVESNLENIVQMKLQSTSESDRIFHIFCQNSARHRIPKKYKNSKGSNILSLKHNKFPSPAGINSRNTIISPADFSRDYSSYDSEDDSDFNEDVQIDNNRSSRPVYQTRRLINNSSSPDNLRRSRRSRYEPLSYSDDINIEDYGRAVESRNKRANDRDKARSKRTRIIDDESEDSCSGTDESDDNNEASDNFISLDDSDDNRKSRKQRRSDNNDSDNSERPKKPKRKGLLRKKRTIIDNDENDTMENYSPPKSVIKKSKKLKWTSISVPIGIDIDRKWLQVDTVNDQEYVPQMGDRIIYFAQGHKEMLQIFAENSSPPWQTFQQKWPLVECDIIDISYEFPTSTEYNMCPSIIAVVKLLITRIPTKIVLHNNGQISVELSTLRATRNSTNNETSFTVKLRKFNLPDFLVPLHLFQRALRVPWYEGMKIQTKYQDIGLNGETVETVSNARVVKVTNKDPEWNQSPWECLEVLFEDSNNGETNPERLCPWEVIPIFDESSNLSNLWNSFSTPQILEEKYEKIKRAIEELMVDDSVFKPLFEEVDSVSFPDYDSFIHVPIYLSLIYRRVCNKYYRQIEALQNDIHCLYKNCEYYNYEESLIVINAMALREKLLSFTRDEEISQNMFSSNFNDNGNYSNKLKKRKIDNEEGPSSPNGNENVLRIRIKSRHENSLVNISDERDQHQNNNSSNNDYIGRSDLENTSMLKINLRRKESNHSQNNSSGRITNKDKVTYNEDSEDSNDDEENDDDDDDDDDESNDSEDRVSNKRSKNNNRKAAARTSRSNRRTNIYNEDDSGDENKRSIVNESKHATQKVDKRIDPQIRKDILKILSFLDELDEETQYFADPITDDIAPGYSMIFERPMDRSTLRANYDSRIYTSVESIVDDVLVMYSNCEAYNEPDSIIYNEGLRQKYCFRSFVMKDLNISLPDEEQSIRRSSRPSKPLTNYSDSPVPNKETKNFKDKKRNSRSNVEEYKSTKQTKISSNNNSDFDSTKKIVSRIDPELKRQMTQIVSYADQIDSDNNFFADPIDFDEAPGYCDIIEKPLDLSSIRSNIAARIYSSLEELIADINLMYDNCVEYNDPKSTIGKEAKRQKKLFNNQLRTI